MMPVLRVVRITWKSSAIPVASYTQVLCSTYTLRHVRVQLGITSDGVNSGKLTYALVAARREPGAQKMKQSLP